MPTHSTAATTQQGGPRPAEPHSSDREQELQLLPAAVRDSQPKQPQQRTVRRLPRAPSGNRLCTFLTSCSAISLQPHSMAATATCSCTSHTA